MLDDANRTHLYLVDDVSELTHRVISDSATPSRLSYPSRRARRRVPLACEQLVLSTGDRLVEKNEVVVVSHPRTEASQRREERLKPKTDCTSNRNDTNDVNEDVCHPTHGRVRPATPHGASSCSKTRSLECPKSDVRYGERTSRGRQFRLKHSTARGSLSFYLSNAPELGIFGVVFRLLASFQNVGGRCLPQAKNVPSSTFFPSGRQSTRRAMTSPHSLPYLRVYRFLSN